MRLFGFDITPRQKAPVAPLSVQNAGALVPAMSGGVGSFLGGVLESFTGAWQRNITSKRNLRDVTAFSAVYACVTLIADDISKCRIKLVRFDPDARIWREIIDRNSPYHIILRKPNSFQTRIQFLNYWVISRKLYGNAYVLKQRDARNMVRALYVLDPNLVNVIIDEEGGIWYMLKRDPLSEIGTDVVVPASEIIHDREATFFHPLCGMSPLHACGLAAMQGLGIQVDSESFFRNRATPGGILTAPGDVPTEKMNLMKAAWNDNYGPNGRWQTAVLTNGMKFEPIRMTAVDVQLIEQLRWTVEDVARAFKVPLHMLGVMGTNPSYNNIGALNQAYYSQVLQKPIEDIELLLDEGLGLIEADYGCELDLEALVRMDPGARMDASAKGVGAGILSPNEARAREDMPPVPGGATPYLQQQNYSLAALAERDANDPFAAPPPPPPAAESDEDEEGEEEEEGQEDEAADDEDTAEERAALLLGTALVKRFMDEAANVS